MGYSLGKFMVNFIKHAIDHSIFLWWLNLSSSSSLKVIGGDSNLPERKLIIKALQHSEIMMHMLEVKGEWISQKEIEDMTVLVYSKFSPFNNASSQLKHYVKFSRQSFLSLMAIYNLCNIGLNYNMIGKNKLKFKLCDELTVSEKELLQSIYSKLSVIFKKVFEEEDSELVDSINNIKKPSEVFDDLMLVLMVSSFSGGLYNFIGADHLDIGAALLALSLTILGYFYITRVKALGKAFQRTIIYKIHKQKGA